MIIFTTSLLKLIQLKKSIFNLITFQFAAPKIMKNEATQKSDKEESKEKAEPQIKTLAKFQLNLLIRALKMIESEGVLNKFLFDESDLITIKDEIKDLLHVNRDSLKMNSIWMNYSGSSSVGGHCKTSELLNIGKKNPILHYVNKKPNVENLTIYQTSEVPKRSIQKR